MNKLIAILVAEGRFEAGVETPAGFEFGQFENTGEGVEDFSAFAAQYVRQYGPAYRFCICSLNGDLGVIGEEVIANGYGPTVLNPMQLVLFARSNGLPEKSVTTLARASVHAFPFLRTD